MSVVYEKLKPVYRRLWDTMTIHPDVVESADTVARKILSHKDRYVSIEQKTQVPWFFIGLVHNRESGLNFNTYLGNGQPLNRRTTIVPIGRGPFSSFEEGAIDAFQVQDMIGRTDWSLERIAFLLEGFNGFGYYYKGVNSPYLWAGSNQYTSGKYVADHDFRPDVVDHQLGSMVVLARLAAMDADVKNRLGAAPDVTVATTDVASLGRGSSGERVRDLQTALAQQGFQVGEVDGRYGPNTAAAVRAFQSAHGLPATGVADRATQDALLGARVAGAAPKPEDVLQHLFQTLLAQRPPAPGPTAGAQPGAADNTLQAIIAALLGRQPASGPVAAPGGAPPLSTLSFIDQILGGEALAGKKTAIGIIAYVILAILQATGHVGTATGEPYRPPAAQTAAPTPAPGAAAPAPAASTTPATQTTQASPGQVAAPAQANGTKTPTGGILTTLIAAFTGLGLIGKIDRLIKILGMAAGKAA